MFSLAVFQVVPFPVTTAVPVPAIPAAEALVWQGEGNEVYVQALEGIINVNEAVDQFTDKLVEKYGFEISESKVEVVCALEGTVEVWHRWQGLDTVTLEQLARNFEVRCPKTLIDLVSLGSNQLY